jgi:hypothetical protein
MLSRRTYSAADRAIYGVFVLATLLGFWIGASFLFARHQSDIGLPRRE